MILASTSTTSSLDELPQLADKTMDVASPSVSAIQPPPQPQLSTEVDQLRSEEVTRLQELMTALAHQNGNRPPPPRPPTPHSTSPHQSPPDPHPPATTAPTNKFVQIW